MCGCVRKIMFHKKYYLGHTWIIKVKIIIVMHFYASSDIREYIKFLIYLNKICITIKSKKIKEVGFIIIMIL